MRKNESKYKLVTNHIVDRINDGTYTQGDWIPSINEFREIYGISRDTVFSGLKELRSRGIIESNHGVGYYIASTIVPSKHNIFLLFNEFNEFKEDLYNSFMAHIDKSAAVDLYFHNYNRRIFETLVRDANNKYTTYIIMPGKFQGIGPLLDELSGNVFLLDHFHPELTGKFSSVAQNFAKDTYEALNYGLERLRKYAHIVMIQKNVKEPVERYEGLCAFAREHNFTTEYIDTGFEGRQITPGEVYMVVSDRILVELLKQAKHQKLKPGADFGIISYNDTPLKEILSGGITSLSTDFKLMGKTMAALIDKKEIQTIENPWKLNLRKSL